MTKVTIDRALIEQALYVIDAWERDCDHSLYWRDRDDALVALRAALAEPAVEPACKQPLQVHKPTGWVAHKNQYAVPVLFNPYTGEPRDVRDVQSDPQGVLIVPPGKVDMIAASPPPLAETARTSQDVCTVPLLSDDEVAQCIKDASKGSAINRDGSTSQRIVRSAEQLVRRKARL